MRNVISTPFGNFEVKQNNKPLEFNCIIKNYSSNKSPALIRLYVVEVETKGQDSLICGFEKPIFERLSKDEHSTTLFVENDTLVLGLCSLNPGQQTYIMATNNEYGFTYQEENKITLILCCIEKDKFKDAKKVIEKAIKSEIEATMNIKIKKEKKPSKSIVTIFLFGLLSLVYVAFAFLFMKYKIVSNETLKKIGIGILGVLLTSFALANLSGSKEQREKKKTTFLISLLLLAIILIAMGLTTYIILTRIGIVKNEMVLGIGLTIVALAILCLFVSEYKIERNSQSEIVKKKNVNEIEGLNRKTEQLNPFVLNFSIMFPRSLKESWISLVDKLQIQEMKASEQVTTYQLSGEMVKLFNHIELEELDMADLTETEKLMLYCVYTRHKNGYIREKYVKKILEMELSEWEFPFLLKLSGEYIYEILMIIYNSLQNKDNQKLKEFAKNNKELLCEEYARMLKYWNQFYRTKKIRFHNYIGKKLFYECYGYTRKYEKKRYQCACCEKKTIFGYLIHYYNEPCPVCYWQNNIIQNNDPNKEGINQVTLKEAQENYQKFGAIKEEYVSLVRKATEKEIIKPNVDQILKLLRLTLVQEGFIRKEEGIYEKKNQSFKITYHDGYLLIEKAKSAKDIKENIWEKIGSVKIELDNQSLVKKVMTILKKSQEKKKTIRLKKAEKEKVVEEEINAWNPLGLIKNDSPKGEYQLEIKKITTKLSKLKSEKELQEHIEQVFQKLFGENLFIDKKKEIEKIANKIWKKVK